jgi:hypothetical protein
MGIRSRFIHILLDSIYCDISVCLSTISCDFAFGHGSEARHINRIGGVHSWATAPDVATTGDSRLIQFLVALFGDFLVFLMFSLSFFRSVDRAQIVGDFLGQSDRRVGNPAFDVRNAINGAQCVTGVT